MLPANSPRIWSAYPRERFNGASVNGKIYGVPQNWTNYHGENFIWREDLRKKYSLPEMSMDWDIIENYIKTVIENEDIPFAVTYQYTNPVNLYQTIDLSKKYSGIDATAVGMRSERGTKNTMLFYEEPSYREFAQRMKTWCDMGFWSKSILATADSTDHTDLFAEGLIFVVTNSHLDRFQGIPERIIKENIPYEVGFIPHATVSDVYYHTRTAQDLTVIPNGSKNPERALMVLDKMLMDKEYYDLTQYGMLGLNYELDENNNVSHKNIDTTAHRFDLCLWALRNQDLAYPVTRFWDRKANYEDIYFPKLQYDPFDGFAIDLKDIQPEFTAVTQVIKEYGDPIQWGIVPDPNAAVDTLIQRMNEAGIQKFKAEIDRQISVFLDSK
jgi:putative aldouronate transport system substrate-binding protein